MISTPGNLTVITAPAKAGKSAFVGAMLAAPMVPEDGNADTLGVSSRNAKGWPLVHFDTEQSIDDHWRLVDRAIRRAGLTNIPPWLFSHCVTGWDAKKIKAAVWQCTHELKSKCGGIHSLHVDGIADMVSNVNDPLEANGFVAELHGLAIEMDCPIICVLHLNPGTDKSRGHLGSQLERKAETNLTLSKDDEITSVYSTKQRRAPILKADCPKFRWDSLAGMHITCTEAEAAFPAAKLEQYRREVEDVFSGRTAMRYGELVKAIESTLKKAEKTAQKRAGDYLRATLICKDVCNLDTKKA